MQVGMMAVVVGVIGVLYMWALESYSLVTRAGGGM